MTTVPESANTVHFDTTWTTAVRRVSELAQARLPEVLHGRVQRATGLVLAQGVLLDEDGHTCQVRAADGQRWYSANGSCPCEDHQRAPEHLCKHRLSRMIYLRASELLREGLPPVSGEGLCETATSPVATDGVNAGSPAPPPLPEAPASVNTHITLAGHQVQVTLRDTDETRLLARLEALLARYPVETSPPVQSPRTPTRQPTTAEGWCLVHGVAMIRQTNARGSCGATSGRTAVGARARSIPLRGAPERPAHTGAQGERMPSPWARGGRP